MTPAAIVSLLVEVSWRAVFVAALVGGVLLLWRVKGGAVRHAAWTAVMVAMLLMPALLVVVPEMPIPLPAVRALSATDDATPVSEPSANEAPALASSPAPRVPGSSSRADTRLAQPVPFVETRSTSGWATSLAWSRLALIIWLTGIVVSLIVMLMGWRLARRLIATARISEIDPRVMESPTVAAPCAVGLWRVQVLVPQAWRTWPRAGRDAVLQHELAHVMRRDLLVLFVARLNRAIFWFHPVAWWLERRIAATAEQACDEAVLQSGQDPQRYATVLLEMAAALRSSGARVAWQSLGMAEGTDLESRIDRVLTGEVPRLSRGRAIGVMATSTVALVVAISCAQASPELAVNPEITARMERDAESRTAGAAARSMSADEVRALTDQVLANPEDRGLVDRLLRFYSAQRDLRPGTAFVPSPEFLKSHRRVTLWAIEHQGGSRLAQWRVPKAADVTGYEAARALWATRLSSEAVSLGDYEHAIRFTLMSDPSAAERMVLEGRRRFPRLVKADGTLGASLERNWANQLAGVYTSVMLGSYEDPHFIRQSNPILAASPEAQRVRALVESSRDAFLVGAVGDGLTAAMPHASQPLPFDPKALGMTYLRRSLELNPDQPRLRESLERKAWQAFLNSQAHKVLAATGTRLDQLTPEQALSLPEDLQWTTVPYLADRAVGRAMARLIHNNSDSEWREAVRLAKLYSDRALTLLERRTDPNLARMRYTAHSVRGFAAIAENDRPLAIRHLKASIDAVAEKPVLLMDGGWAHSLTNYLITAGETAVVAEAFERLAIVAEPDFDEFKKSAADLRAGRMPDQYQRMVARLETQR